MPCCGNKRAALISNSTYAHFQKSLYAQAKSVPEEPVSSETKSNLLKYLRHGAISLRGPVSGQVYTFTGGDHTTSVDEKDSQILMRTGLFSLVEEK
jgi:hypothetical protein